MPAAPLQEKYNTSNPAVRFLLNRFFSRLRTVIGEVGPATVLDAGCGEGEILVRGALPAGTHVVSLDLHPQSLAAARQRIGQRRLVCGSTYQLPFASNSVDAVLCLEVLEHLDQPERALAELSRVARQAVILSVPHEPWFRLGNLARGKYLDHRGNHPEHVQHWNPSTLRAMLREEFNTVELFPAFPWIIARCRPETQVRN
ncbi:MAG: class I SAM-dependent methyltransferase [Candidatus Solibacter usitatus]|nr:class I SAM-dependent methyltransferase [Candidatus Solibacter usitatus]